MKNSEAQQLWDEAISDDEGAKRERAQDRRMARRTAKYEARQAAKARTQELFGIAERDPAAILDTVVLARVEALSLAIWEAERLLTTLRDLTVDDEGSALMRATLRRLNLAVTKLGPNAKPRRFRRK